MSNYLLSPNSAVIVTDDINSSNKYRFSCSRTLSNKTYKTRTTPQIKNVLNSFILAHSLCYRQHTMC